MEKLLSNNIRFKGLFLVLIALCFTNFSFGEEVNGIVLNKEYQSRLQPSYLFLDQRNLKITHFQDLFSDTTDERVSYNIDKYFNYVETKTNNFMVFTCEISDVHFLTLLSHSFKETSSFVQTIDHEWYYIEAEKRFGPSWLEPVTVKEATSYISESVGNSQIRYIPERWNFSSNPWAVSNKEKKKIITFSFPPPNDWYPGFHMNIDTLVISNGFVMPSKPHLYEENCRAKTIRITVNGKTIERVLEDTPDYQLVPLPEVIKPNPYTMVELEIIDWYEGTKYNDIVIASVSVPVIRVR